jgi:hypothetical protein
MNSTSPDEDALVWLPISRTTLLVVSLWIALTATFGHFLRNCRTDWLIRLMDGWAMTNFSPACAPFPANSIAAVVFPLPNGAETP